MVDNPVTPSRLASNAGPGTMNSQKATNIRSVRMVLKANGMPLEDPNTKRLHPQVHQFATEIVNSERNSPVRPGWKANFSKQRNQYATRNGNTWIKKIWAALQNPERNVRKRDGEGSMLEEKGWEAVAWDKSGLDDNWDQLLHMGSLPRLKTEDENQVALLESLPRVSTPKPDIAFGLNDELFNEVEMVVNDRYHMYVQVSEGIYHPWFLVETKTNGTIEEVEIQCCRGGAALVRCSRQLIEDSDPDAFAAKHGPDLESMAFSLALVPSCAHIYYHWANRDVDGQVLYHMHFLKSFALRDEDACVGLLHVVNNILDWGLDARLISVKKILDEIHSLTTEKAPKKRKRAKSMGGHQSQSSYKYGEENEEEEDQEGN